MSAQDKAAPAPSSLAGGEVEAIARAIDPGAWAHIDACHEAMKTCGENKLADFRKVIERRLRNSESIPAAERVIASLAALSPEAPARERGWIEAAKRPDTTGDLWLAVDAAGKLFPGVFVNHRIPTEAALVQRIMLPGRDALTPRHEASASEGEREPLCMAYKTGYAEGVEDSNGMFDRDSCEEGWGQYAEKLSAQPALPARLPLPTVDDGRGGRRPINPQDDR